MKVLIATIQVPFISGGAEVLASTLLQACRSRGHEAEIVAIPFNPSSHLLDQMLACRLNELTEIAGQKIDRLIGLKFPAYLIPHPRKSLWILHQHRMAYEFWGDARYCDMMHIPNGAQVRDTIINADNKTFKECGSSIFTISKNVSQRLLKFNSVESKPLYPPPQDADRFFCSAEKDYLFYPSRINHFKRQRLVIEALTKTKNRVRVVFGGKADQEDFALSLKSLVKELNLMDRVTFLGQMSEEDKYKYYSEAIAVVYTPLDEDYGYVTLEAMLSSKAIITCSDSGGPLEFVQHQENGLVS